MDKLNYLELNIKHEYHFMNRSNLFIMVTIILIIIIKYEISFELFVFIIHNKLYRFSIILMLMGDINNCKTFKFIIIRDIINLFTNFKVICFDYTNQH